jgi:hypothetical protein
MGRKKQITEKKDGKIEDKDVRNTDTRNTKQH